MLAANGLSNGFKQQLHLYSKYFSSKVTSNILIHVNFCSPSKLTDKFKHYHFGVFKEVMDATQQKVSFDDIIDVYQGVDVEEMLDVDSWFLVLHHKFPSESDK